MRIIVSKTEAELGRRAAECVARSLRECINRKGSARLVLSTGASQLCAIDVLVTLPVDWSRVEMFHLDEYVNLPETHPASFRKYLKERFIEKVHPGKYHLVDGTGECIADLTRELGCAPIDVGVVGIGENGHIAFNDPPADFDTQQAYIIVKLDDACKRQQVREGWFATEDDVPKEAVSMTVSQILKCEKIISIVPRTVKADAVNWTLTRDKTNLVPATALKGHPDWTLFLDEDSFSRVDEKAIRPDPAMPEYTLERE